MPYLVFEVDQSERGTLAKIAATVFGLTFLGAPLFRLFKARATLLIAVAGLAICRLGIQFTESPGARWRLGAATIVACLWVLILILPQGGRSIGSGIGFAFLIDLDPASAARNAGPPLDAWRRRAPAHHRDRPRDRWSPRIALIRSDALSPFEMPFAASARYIGIGSGLALWLVAAGNSGFAELQSELGLPGSFALLAIGRCCSAFWCNRARNFSRSRNAAGNSSFSLSACWERSRRSSGCGEWSRWLDLVAVPVFAFAVVTLTMQCAIATERPQHSRTLAHGRRAHHWRAAASRVHLSLLRQHRPNATLSVPAGRAHHSRHCGRANFED